jgi:hypothetical protein
VYVFLTLGLKARKNHLKAQAAVWDGRHCNRQTMNVLTLVFLVSIRKLFAHPAFEIRDVAGQVPYFPAHFPA